MKMLVCFYLQRHKANSASCPDSQEDSTARLAATKGLTLNGSSTAAAAAADVLPVAVEASQPVRAAPPWPMFDWHLLLQVAKVWQIWFLGCTEAVKRE